MLQLGNYLQGNTLDQVHDNVEPPVLLEDPSVADDIWVSELLFDDLHLAYDITETFVILIVARLNHENLKQTSQSCLSRITRQSSLKASSCRDSTGGEISRKLTSLTANNLGCPLALAVIFLAV